MIDITHEAGITMMLKWILLRLVLLMTMKQLGIRLTPKTVLLLLGGLSAFNTLILLAAGAAQRLAIRHDHPPVVPNAEAVMDMGTLVLAMCGAAITFHWVAACILAANA